MSMADEIESTGKKDKMQQDLSGVVAQQLPPQIALAKVISFYEIRTARTYLPYSQGNC